MASRFAALAAQLAPAVGPVFTGAFNAHLRESVHRGMIGSAERHADLDRLAPENGQGTVVGECDVAIAIDPDDRMREP